MTDHDPLSRLTESFGLDLEAAAASHPPRRRRLPRPPVLAGGGLVAAAALAAVLFVAGAFQGGDGLLTPQEAVAAASRDLSSDGILRWKTAYVDGPGTTPKRSTSAYDSWIDLKTGARHDRLLGNPVNSHGGRTPSQTWYNGSRTRWVIWGPYKRADPRLLVMRTIRRAGEKIPEFKNPIDELRKTLALGAAGKAKVEDAGTINYLPVAKVTQREQIGEPGDPRGFLTTITWITREATPRLVRQTQSSDGKYAFTHTEEPLVWDLMPRSAAGLAHVKPPRTFDPAKYVFRTQVLGPPKR